MLAQRCGTRYGDFDALREDVTADAVAGGAMVQARAAGNEARVARQQERDADPSFAGLPEYWLGRALVLPALGQRDRSALQWRVTRRGVMRCRS